MAHQNGTQSVGWELTPVNRDENECLEEQQWTGVDHLSGPLNPLCITDASHEILRPKPRRPQNQHHAYNTRFGADFLSDQHNLELNKKNPYYIGAVQLNKLPLNIRILDFKSFVTLFQNTLISRAFYSIDELVTFKFLNSRE
ncbi:hypothetical protein HHI36_011348 [Cryptolaemus montrouzieri]|uniref:Uncharacterized protein n=1 Tax=Cryptolaemus montrouzieri TaxID=559131 RepID=A0ABD2MLH0_9CUCU